MKNEMKKQFYAKCGEILGIPHEWNDPVPRRTRWNNRILGNGRFVGFGVIRWFGKSIHIMSKEHGIHTFTSQEDVFKFLNGINNTEGA